MIRHALAARQTEERSIVGEFVTPQNRRVAAGDADASRAGSVTGITSVECGQERTSGLPRDKAFRAIAHSRFPRSIPRPAHAKRPGDFSPGRRMIARAVTLTV